MANPYFNVQQMSVPNFMKVDPLSDTNIIRNVQGIFLDNARNNREAELHPLNLEAERLRLNTLRELAPVQLNTAIANLAKINLENDNTKTNQQRQKQFFDDFTGRYHMSPEMYAVQTNIDRQNEKAKQDRLMIQKIAELAKPKIPLVLPQQQQIVQDPSNVTQIPVNLNQQVQEQAKQARTDPLRLNFDLNSGNAYDLGTFDNLSPQLQDIAMKEMSKLTTSFDPRNSILVSNELAIPNDNRLKDIGSYTTFDKETGMPIIKEIPGRGKYWDKTARSMDDTKKMISSLEYDQKDLQGKYLGDFLNNFIDKSLVGDDAKKKLTTLLVDPKNGGKAKFNLNVLAHVLQGIDVSNNQAMADAVVKLIDKPEDYRNILYSDAGRAFGNKDRDTILFLGNLLSGAFEDSGRSKFNLAYGVNNNVIPYYYENRPDQKTGETKTVKVINEKYKLPRIPQAELAYLLDRANKRYLAEKKAKEQDTIENFANGLYDRALIW